MEDRGATDASVKRDADQGPDQGAAGRALKRKKTVTWADDGLELPLAAGGAAPSPAAGAGAAALSEAQQPAQEAVVVLPCDGLYTSLSRDLLEQQVDTPEPEEGSEPFSRRQLLERRLGRMEQLGQLYEAELWALLEELRLRHAQFAAQAGRSVWKEGGGSNSSDGGRQGAPQQGQQGEEAAAKDAEEAMDAKPVQQSRKRQRQAAGAAAAAGKSAAGPAAKKQQQQQEEKPDEGPVSSLRALWERQQQRSEQAPAAGAVKEEGLDKAAQAKPAGKQQQQKGKKEQQQKDREKKEQQKQKEKEKEQQLKEKKEQQQQQKEKKDKGKQQQKGKEKKEQQKEKEQPAGKDASKDAGAAASGAPAAADVAKSEQAAQQQAKEQPAAPPMTPPVLPEFEEVERLILSGSADAAGIPPVDEAVLVAARSLFVQRLSKLGRLEQSSLAAACRELDALGGLALLCGRRRRYVLRRSLVGLGRGTESQGKVDVDLTLEGEAAGSAQRISRQQAQLFLDAGEGGWRLRCTGRRGMLVNGAPLVLGQTVALPSLSHIAVGGVSLLFVANTSAMARMLARQGALLAA